MTYQSCTGHAIGVTNGDAATVDVVNVGVDAQLIAAVNGLAGKGFIQFPQSNIVNLQTMLFEQFRHGVNGTYAHFFGGTSRHCHAAVNT